MARHPIHAQPPLEFVPPNLQMGVVGLIGRMVPAVMKLRTPVAAVDANHADRLVELYRQFQAGETRFLIAFRHPSTLDPLSLWYLLGTVAPERARALGVRLERPPHTYFLYDRGVPLWAGPAVGWLLPRAGGISVQRGKLDRMSLKTARETFLNGEQPLAVAPEGATNGLNEVVSPLEPGVAQMAFWCLDDLRAAGRTETVQVVPIGLQYRYIHPPWEAIDRLLGTLEQECGLAPEPSTDRYLRLRRIADHLLTELEAYYERFYQQPMEAEAPDLGARLTRLLEAALRTSEQFFGVQARGSLTDRCRRIEQAGWDRIYREDLKRQPLSDLQRGLADRVAEESDRRMWHMRIVEAFVAVNGSYVQENPSADRFAETVNLLYKTVQRLKGVESFHAPVLGKQTARLEVGEPILVDNRYGTYSSGRQGARQSVADLTADVQQALQRMARPDIVAEQQQMGRSEIGGSEQSGVQTDLGCGKGL